MAEGSGGRPRSPSVILGIMMVRFKDRWLENIQKHNPEPAFQAGDQVYWKDPDECIASGYGKFIKHVNEEVALITKDGVSLEVFITELS